ncbi:ATP-dependent Clp protease proteolytic subunit [bacterium]|nr:ATP-dependent Clp protease proteolytic subunit [bacterium]
MDFTLKNINITNRDIFIYKDIDEDSSKQLNKEVNDIIFDDNNIINNNKYILDYLYKNNKIDHQQIIPPVNIYLETFGGVIYSALNMYDSIKILNEHAKTNIIAKGKCMSAGIIILLSVPLEQRIATSSTTFMIHQASSIAIGKTADMEDDVKEAKRLNEIMFNIIKNNTAITQEDLDKNYDRKADWMLTAKEALKLKLISKII